MIKAAAASLMASTICLLLRRHNPEVALLLGLMTALAVFSATLRVLDGLRDFRGLIRQLIGNESETLLSPVVKCLAISVVTRFSAESCRDSSQHAAAAAVEFAGSACSIASVLPLLMSVLKTIGGLR